MAGNRPLGLAALPLAIAFVVAACGCADVVAPTTRTAVDSSLATLDEPQNRRLVEELLTSDEYIRATRGLTRAALDEVLSGGGPGSDARLTKLADDFARDISPALGQTLDGVVVPRVQAAIAASVRAALDQVLSDQTRQRVGDVTASVAREVIASVGPQISAAISNGITMSIERVLQRDLGPGVGKLLDDDTPALARATRAAAAAALQGAADAMNGPFGDMLRKERRTAIAELQAAEAQQQRALIDELEKQIAESRRWLQTLLIMFAVWAVVIAGIGALLWHLLTEQRKLRDRVQHA